MKIKTVLLLIVAIICGIVGIVLLFSEPAPGEWLDSVTGLLLMKAVSIFNFIIVAYAWLAIPEQDRKRIESWINLHFN